MERRAQPRIPLECEVLLCFDSFGLVRGVTKDISAEGVFVTTNYLSINENANIDVCFMSNDQKTSQFHKINARVKRVANSGLGIQFTKELTQEFLQQNAILQ